MNRASLKPIKCEKCKKKTLNNTRKIIVSGVGGVCCRVVGVGDGGEDGTPEGVAAPVGEEAGHSEADDHTEAISVRCLSDE